MVPGLGSVVAELLAGGMPFDAGKVVVPGNPALIGLGPNGSFGLSVELQPINPTQSVIPTLAKIERIQLLRIPCGMMFPSPRKNLYPSTSMPTERLFSDRSRA
ncbi:MAG TPA: hypothetical protein VG097_15675 [Gemmata sp.]|nr:hypothetical protein [Gemmata sp.]